MKELGEGWAPELLALFTDGDVDPVSRPIYGLPAGHRWDHVAGVTLVGDAAHLTPPDGEGANWALYDGAELGKAIVSHPGDIEAGLVSYEQELFPRSTESSVEGYKSFETNFGDHAPENLRSLMMSLLGK